MFQSSVLRCLLFVGYPLLFSNMKPEFRTKFLENRDDTGRFIVYSMRTGKNYCVEPIGDGVRTDWGSYNPGTGVIEHKKGDGKHKGSVSAKESMIVAKNGFAKEHIHTVKGGESPMDYINELDAKYGDKI